MGTVAHCGGEYVSRPALDLIPVPERTTTYMPVPHGFIADQILTSVEDAGFEVTKKEFIVAKEGQQLFGYYRIARPETRDLGYGAAVGFRSSYNKTLPVGLSVGSDVFICDNLAFSGSFTFFRRHTPNVFEDMHEKIYDAVAALPQFFANDDYRFGLYREARLQQSEADHLINTFLRDGTVPLNEATKLIREWYQPSYAEHTDGGNTVWRLFNAATESLKTVSPSNLAILPVRTQRLQRTLDKFVGWEDAIAA